MRGRLPVNRKKIDKVSDMYFDKYSQLIQSQQPQDMDPQMGQADVGAAQGLPASPQDGMAQTIPNMVDRTHDVREIVKNYERLEKLVSSNLKMWQKMLESDGQDTAGFLDDPNEWDDKKWGEATKATERLVKDANNALMKTGETGAIEGGEVLGPDLGGEDEEIDLLGEEAI